MSEQSVTRTVTVVNPQGLHARPARLFVQLANSFNAEIEVTKDGEIVDGKSILQILTLGAEKGTELTLRATGPEAPRAIDALAELVAQGFAEMNEQDSAAEGQADQTGPDASNTAGAEAAPPS